MKIIDVTKVLTEDIPLYPGDPYVLFEEITDQTGDGIVTTSKIQMGSHSGTHIDAPAHIDPDLHPANEFPLDWVQGYATVIESQSLDESISKLIVYSEDIKFLIIKSSEKESIFPSITDQLAFNLKSSGIHIIGTDRLSIDDGSSGLVNHQTLLNKGVWIIENLDLSKVSRGPYRYTIAPLKISVRDGAPVRVFLSDDYKDLDFAAGDIVTKAQMIKSHMAEAEKFVQRAGIKPVDSLDLLTIANLWLESDEHDNDILDSLRKLNQSMIENRGLISVERGATPLEQYQQSHNWDFHCEWSLSWANVKGVTITLTTPNREYQPQFKISGTNSRYVSNLFDIYNRKKLGVLLINCVIMEMCT